MFGLKLFNRLAYEFFYCNLSTSAGIVMDMFYNREENRLRSGWRLLLQFLLMFACTAFFLLPLLMSNSGTGGAFSLPNTLAVCLGSTASVWVAGRWLDRRAFERFGIRPSQRWFGEAGLGILFGLAAMGLVFGIEYLSGWISLTGYGWERPGGDLWSWSFISFLLAMVMVGFYEELVFRGYQILNLSEGLRFGHLQSIHAACLAVLISSVFFGLMHAWNSNATAVSTVNIAAAGAVLAVPYVVTGRLGYSVGIHIGWNFTQAGIFGFPVSGTPFSGSLFQIEQEGPQWMTGGSFGPEAGLVGLVGLAAILALFIALRSRSGKPIELAPIFSRGKREGGKTDEQGS